MNWLSLAPHTNRAGECGRSHPCQRTPPLVRNCKPRPLAPPPPTPPSTHVLISAPGLCLVHKLVALGITHRVGKSGRSHPCPPIFHPRWDSVASPPFLSPPHTPPATHVLVGTPGLGLVHELVALGAKQHNSVDRFVEGEARVGRSSRSHLLPAQHKQRVGTAVDTNWSSEGG